MPSRRLLPLVTCLALLAALAGCGHRRHAAPATPPAPVPTSAAPTPTPPLRSPLTGLPVPALRPVVAVKIDNVGTYGTDGLDAADVVYCEEVEGGLTRLLGVFSATPPAAAGPVRSARESDLELLAEYGPVALAFSGANSGVLAEVRAAPLRDDSYDAQTAAYSLDRGRPQPYQFLVDVARLAARAPGAVARDVGFRFGPVPITATPGTRFAVRYPDTTMSGTFGAGGYAIARNGRALVTGGAPVTTTDVLLQYVTVRGSRYVDHNGNATPYSQTVGTGAAVLLRGGHAYAGRWSRAAAADPTSWTAADGGPLALAPGRTWVVLVPVGAPVSVG